MDKEKGDGFLLRDKGGRTEGRSHLCVSASDDNVSVKADKVIKQTPADWESLLEVIQSNLLLTAELPSKLVQIA